MRDGARLQSHLHHAQSQVPLERIKVAVAMKQFMALGDAECRDERVDGSAHRHSTCAERSVISSGGERDFAAHHWPEFERREVPADAVKIEIRAKSLQDFSENQIAYKQVLGCEPLVEQIGFPSRAAVEVIDPDRCIHPSHERPSTIPTRRMVTALPFKLAATPT